MKTPLCLAVRSISRIIIASLGLVVAPANLVKAASATLLFQDDFNAGLPGWTCVQPPGAYSGSVIWQYDIERGIVFENSNVFTDSSTSSSTRTAPMLVNDTLVSASNFTYSVRMIANDNDGCGLIFGYQNQNTFYRVTFCNESRAGWPYYGFNVDRMNGGEFTDLFGAGTPGYVPSFVYQFPLFAVGHRPFDVTIGMTNGAFSLTVVDDPTNSAVVYNLVQSKPLPSYQDGKVGFFVWGMSATVADGLPNVGIRYANASLSPLPLTGNTNPLASTWTTLTTSRGDGTSNVTATAGLAPLWTLPILASGPSGRLRETAGLFVGGDNTAAGSTNFAAASIVAGDVNWSNYLYSARLIPSDDDGFGLLLRYSSPSNWYRIAFRPQFSGAGAKHGISIQKNVEGVFDQIMWDTNYNPSASAPMDVYASISTNRLTVLTVINPDAASPTVNLFGPFDITGPTVDQGKIGLFSWAQLAIDIDFVRVHEVAGQGLGVTSTYGNPDPPVGMNDIPSGTLVTATNQALVSDAPGTRRILTGWKGAGSVPVTGITNSVTFNMTSVSVLVWNWRTEHQLTVSATAGGTASYLGSQFLPEGTNVTVTATNNPGYLFVGWAGGSIALSTNLALTMIRPINVTAKFAPDSDGDGLADDWELNYFGNLAQGPGDDPDGDGLNNLTEYQQGTNPAFIENVLFTDGFSSRWINEARDRALPGWFIVTNFGSGFRGLWENSNQNRTADDAGFIGAPFISLTSYATNASFQGPLIIVRSNAWNSAWENTFSLSAEYSVGDNDGICLYFRYLNESNWFRVTICGEQTTGFTRPLRGVTIQKRTNGWFSAVTPTSQSGNAGVFTDELDIVGGKRVRVTVNATNDTFEVRTVEWSVFLNPPDWDTNSYELVQTFTDGSLPSGRIGVGDWGMAAGRQGWNSSTNNPNEPGVQQNPVGSGTFVDNIVLKVGGTNAFVEDWETATLHTDFPAGWENPYAAIPGPAGDWHVTAHGTFTGLGNAYGTLQTGTAQAPKTDAEGPILLAPALTNANYVLELGIHPLDDGGMGFVYDFIDTNNFARVLFDSQAPASGQLAQGVNIGRKSGGVWTDIAAGDPTFVYTPGRKFDVRFANNNGVYTLLAWNTDAPAAIYRWQWTDQPAGVNHRVGLALWNMPDAHFTYFRASSLPALVPSVPFKITNISVTGGNVILNVSKPAGSSYHVLRATAVAGPYATNAANQSAIQYTEPAPTGSSTHYYRLQLLQ